MKNFLPALKSKKAFLIFCCTLFLAIASVSLTHADTIQDFLNSLATKDLGLQIEGNAAFEKDLYVGENVGIGTANPTEKLTVDGVIETSGGVKFADGSVINSVSFNDSSKQVIVGDGETTLDWSLGSNVEFTFTDLDESFVFVNPATPGFLTLKLRQDNVGGRSISFVDGINWESGEEPTLSTEGSQVDLISFYFDGDDYYEAFVRHDLYKVQLPTEGLVAYYPFNGNANDESGNGNNGTVNGAVLTTDRHGNTNSAYYFDGVNDKITIPDNANADISGSITLSAWVKSINGGIIIAKEEPLTYPRKGYALVINKSSQTGYENAIATTIFDNNGNYFGLNTRSTLGDMTNYNNNVWSHVVGVGDVNTGTIRVYFNGDFLGVVDNSALTNIGLNNFPLTIGNRNNPAHPFYGSIDNIRIYNRALSDEEVENLYNQENLSY